MNIKDCTKRASACTRFMGTPYLQLLVLRLPFFCCVSLSNLWGFKVLRKRWGRAAVFKRLGKREEGGWRVDGCVCVCHQLL